MISMITLWEQAKDVSISPDVLEKVIVSVTEQTYAETDTDTDEDGEASEA